MNINIQDSELSKWGIAALVSGAIAVFSANVAGYIPNHILAGLHSTRIQSGNVNQIASHLDQLRSDTQQINRDYRTLLSRFDLLDDDSGETIRRLAAVETSLPLLIESLPLNSDIDRSLLTASIAAAANEVFEVDGGTIVVRRSSLFDTVSEELAALPDQPLPAPLEPQAEHAATTAAMRDALPPMQGVAIGGAISEAAAVREWDAIMSKVGPLLLGTAPLLSTTDTSDTARILAGPLPDIASAEALCSRLTRVSITCEPAPYEGQKWPN